MYALYALLCKTCFKETYSKCKFMSPTLTDSDSAKPGWGPAICILPGYPSVSYRAYLRPHTDKDCTRQSMWPVTAAMKLKDTRSLEEKL